MYVFEEMSCYKVLRGAVKPWWKIVAFNQVAAVSPVPSNFSFGDTVILFAPLFFNCFLCHLFDFQM